MQKLIRATAGLQSCASAGCPAPAPHENMCMSCMTARHITIATDDVHVELKQDFHW